MRPAVQADWLKEFADRELAKGGNFEDIKNLFKAKEDRRGFEARVMELRERIGLDAVLGRADQAEDLSKDASAKLSRGFQEKEFEDEPTQPGADPKDMFEISRRYHAVKEYEQTDAAFKEALDAEWAAAKESEPHLSRDAYIQKTVARVVQQEKSQKAEDKLSGGLSDGKPDSDFDKKQIEKGIEIEKEHTPDMAIRREISKDHLTEHEKYYDFLEEMEKKMEEDKKSKAEIINTLVSLANALEEEGDFVGANIIDRHIQKVAKEAKKETKEKETLPKVLEENPKVKVFIDNLCKSREGHVDFPAILKMLRDERREKIDIHDDDLKEYIKRRLGEEKRDLPDIGDELAGMGYTVFVVTEDDDGNNEIFHTPAPKR
jgi:hypothetical protein